MIACLELRRIKCLLTCAALGLVHFLWSATETPNEPTPRMCTPKCDYQPAFVPLVDLTAGPHFCPNEGKALDLLMLVHSSTEHHGHRDAIRTYTRLLPYRWKVIFVLGKSASEKVARQVHLEQATFGDILQGDFADTYRNLSLKHLFGLSWASRHCAQARSLLKVDDDIYLNYYRLARLVSRVLIKSPNQDFLLCYLHRSMAVIRNTTSKWHVTEAEFPGEKYPPFCSGWGYLTTVRAVSAWLCAAAKTPLFWIDDVFVTGMLREKSCLCPVAINHLFNVDPSQLSQWQRGSWSRRWPFLFSNTEDEGALRQALHWNYLVNERIKKRTKLAC